MYYKAVFDLYRPLEAKIPEEKEILNKMSSDARFASPPVPFTEFQNALDLQDKALAEAQFGGIERTANKRAKELEVDNIMRQYREYVTLVANGNTEIILASGFRHTKTRASSPDMPAVTDLKQITTQVSGQLKIGWKSIPPAKYYQIQIQPQLKTTGPEPLDDAWIPYTDQTATTVIDGLQPLSYYHVRVRAKGAKGYGGFSNISIMLVT